MKKTVFAVSAAALAFASVISTPAYADEDYGNDPLPSVVGDEGQSAQDVCEARLPNDNSGFTATAINESVVWVSQTGPTRTSSTPFQVTPVGSPTYSAFSNFRQLHTNGKSPNIFAQADAGVTSYLGGSDSWYHTQFVDHYATSFDCKVSKWVGSERNPHEVVPPGLQSTGNRTAVDPSLDQVSAGPDQFDHNSSPYVTNVTATNVETVVCISPGSKGGTWKQQNGYGGACNTTLYNSLNPGGTPSASLPS
jgi:hypothetical protein